jgi:hypothetical protein
MKITKRIANITPLSSITLWVIPTLTYLVQKIIGITFESEFVWWILIPSLIVLWFFMNYKVTSKLWEQRMNKFMKLFRKK